MKKLFLFCSNFVGQLSLLLILTFIGVIFVMNDIVDIRQDEAAVFARLFLRHREFNTQTKRMGKVIRLTLTGFSVWRIHTEKETFLIWDKSQIG